MEKLIVKNFGPIKEAEIDLTKYVVFIGDTSTGKSVLAKLITVFRDSLARYPNNVQDMDFKKELIYYNIDFDFSRSSISYFIDDYSVNLENKKLSSNKQVISETVKEEMTNHYKNILKQNPHINFETDIESLLETAIASLQTKRISLYIPAERIINSLVGSSITGLWANNVALPACIKDFSARFDLVKSSSNKFFFKDFGFNYSHENDFDYISFRGETILLNQSSSGIQSLVPLLAVLEYEILNIDRALKTVLLEEPELNLFPIKQKLLIEWITKKINATNYRSIMTTHSPYILSVLDTLMLAKNTFDEHPDLKEEINAIVSEDKWIDYNDISVYEVRNDGTIKSIKNEEFKSIDTNAIDGVSDIISEEFDKLTELRYAQ